VGADLSHLEEGGDPVTPEAVLVDLESVGPAQTHQFVDRCKQLKLPVVVVIPGEQASDHDPSLNADEYIFGPVKEPELAARIKQAIYRVDGPASSKVLRVGELMIDLERYDVTISGRRVSLTYKEFQLLVLLASNPGRVYTRDALLSQVWGYDYLGGTRTVDVHVRRLRSKVEGPGRVYVETIWNVGYRFKTSS
jgi:DNA-binding response OmpR family regulator